MRWLLSVLAICCSVAGAQDWRQALASMPLEPGTAELNRSNCIPLVLKSFRSNDVVKAIVFMPGAADEFYMFRRARAALKTGGSNPSLMDAIEALTNQTFIKLTYAAPLLLLHTEEDPLDLPAQTNAISARTESFLHQKLCAAHLTFIDADWDRLQPILSNQTGVDIHPWAGLYASRHFYRHNFAGWNLSAWEALQCTAYAGKTCFVVHQKLSFLHHRITVQFSYDPRVRAIPQIAPFHALAPTLDPPPASNRAQ